jgi:hypothetical protein
MNFFQQVFNALFGVKTSEPPPMSDPLPIPPAPPAPVDPTWPAGKPLTRGVRNNNPGNLDRDGTEWEGMAADQSGDDRFIIFNSAEYGIRALVKVLISYQAEGYKTVSAMISRWAPPTENDTLAYVNFVAGRMGIAPTTPFDIHDYNLAMLMVPAIIAQENALWAYPQATVSAGLALAGIAPDKP